MAVVQDSDFPHFTYVCDGIMKALIPAKVMVSKIKDAVFGQILEKATFAIIISHLCVTRGP